MSDLIQRSKREKQIARAFDVLEILGGKLPENYDGSKGHITLEHSLKAKYENYIEFEDNTIVIVLESNGHRYTWHSYLYDEEVIDEHITIDNGSLTAVFIQTQLATTTSIFYLYNDNWGSPKIYSSVDSISIGVGEEKQTSPIECYYDVFTTYMISKKRDSRYAMLADDPTIIETIIKLYGKPIKEHVADLKNNDQSWRFSVERDKILSQYDKRIKEASQRYIVACTKALNDLNKSMQSSLEIRDDEINELEGLQQTTAHKLDRS